MVDFYVRSNIKEFTRKLDDFSLRQVPFATAMALTAVAKKVHAAETAALSSVLKKRPTPFTKNAFGVLPARKSTLTAVVYAKAIQGKYLAPSEFGGPQIIRRVALLKPEDIKLNAYGNIPYKKLQQLKARKDIFIISRDNNPRGMTPGVYQRMPGPHKKGSLKLLIKWAEGSNIKPPPWLHGSRNQDRHRQHRDRVQGCALSCDGHSQVRKPRWKKDSISMAWVLPATFPHGGNFAPR